MVKPIKNVAISSPKSAMSGLTGEVPEIIVCKRCAWSSLLPTVPIPVATVVPSPSAVKPTITIFPSNTDISMSSVYS